MNGNPSTMVRTARKATIFIRTPYCSSGVETPRTESTAFFEFRSIVVRKLFVLSRAVPDETILFWRMEMICCAVAVGGAAVDGAAAGSGAGVIGVEVGSESVVRGDEPSTSIGGG